jgi:hypothetical protein
MSPNNPIEDETRLLKVLEFLPESLVDDFVSSYLYNARFPTQFTNILSEYSAYKQTIMSRFSNRKTNRYYNKFNQVFDNLHTFLLEHYWIPDDHYEMYDNPPFLYLNPDIHHNFGGENTNSMLWDKYKRESDKIADEFEKSYDDFVRVAKRQIEKGREKPLYRRWWMISIIYPILVVIIGGFILYKLTPINK